MRRFILLAAFAALLLQLPCAVLAQNADEQRRIDWAEQRGALLFDIDRAAWVTTDDLVARLGDVHAAEVRGWVVERDGTAYVVTYYAGEGAARTAVYRGRVENHRVVSGQVFPAGSRPALTEAQRRIADAREAAARLVSPAPRPTSTSP